MKFLTSELKKFLNSAIAKQIDLDSIFINLGYEIENIKQFVETKNAKLAKVLSAKPHFNADKLRYCQLLSSDQKYDVVCGGRNIKTGQQVIFAPPDSTVCGIKMQVRKIRGLESHGMVLSLQEILNLSDRDVEDEIADDIFAIDKFDKMQIEFVNDLEKDNKFYDLAILNDRKYANNYLLMAKEINSYFGKKSPDPFSILEIKQNFNHKVQKKEHFFPKIKLGKDALGIYAVKAKFNKDIKTPFAIKLVLYKHQIKPQNSIIDLIAYVALLTGNVIYFLPKNEEFSLEKEKLNSWNIFTDNPIQTEKNDGYLVAIASKFFGEYQEEDNSKLPWFKLLNLKGTNNYLLKESLEILLGLADKYNFLEENGQIFGDKKNIKKSIKLEDQEINAYAGKKLELEIIKEKMNLLAFEIKENNYIVPNYRLDIEYKEDLIEELIRLYGINKIKGDEKVFSNKKIDLSEKQKKFRSIGEFLIKYGFYEVKNYHLTTNDNADKFNLWNSKKHYSLKSKYNFKANTLRTSLLEGLLTAHVYNYRRQKDQGLAFFEFSNLNFSEESHLKLGLIYDDLYYPTDSVLIAKKLFLEISKILKWDLNLLEIKENDNNLFNKYLSAKIYYQKKLVAVLGELGPQLLRENKYIRLDKIKRKLYYLEMELGNF